MKSKIQKILVVMFRLEPPFSFCVLWYCPDGLTDRWKAVKNKYATKLCNRIRAVAKIYKGKYGRYCFPLLDVAMFNFTGLNRVQMHIRLKKKHFNDFDTVNSKHVSMIFIHAVGIHIPFPVCMII